MHCLHISNLNRPIKPSGLVTACCLKVTDHLAKVSWLLPALSKAFLEDNILKNSFLMFLLMQGYYSVCKSLRNSNRSAPLYQDTICLVVLLHNFAVWSSCNYGTVLSNKETLHLTLQSKRAGSPNKKGQLYLMAAALRNHLSNKKKECTQTLHTTLLRNTVWGAVPAAGWALSGGSLRQEAWTGADPLHNQRMATWSYRSWWLSCNTSDLDCEGTKAQGISMEAPAQAAILLQHHGKITSVNPNWVWDPAMKNPGLNPQGNLAWLWVWGVQGVKHGPVGSLELPVVKAAAVKV